MPKNKNSTRRTEKEIEFPPQVLEVKEDLKKGNDEYFLTIKKLTETKDLHLSAALRKMWISLENAERKKYNGNRPKDNSWVHYFVMYATYYSDLPDYYYQNKTQRKKLLENINLRAEHLQKILRRYRLDYRLSYSDRRKVFDFHKGLYPDDHREAPENRVDAPKVSELLERLLQHIEKDLNKIPTCKVDKKEKARQFVYDMALYLKNTYGTQLNAVLATATLTIYNVNYSESQVSKILQRTDMGKGDDSFRPFAHPETTI